MSAPAGIRNSWAIAAAECEAESVIVDLSAIKQHGSGLLSSLIRLANALQQRDVELMVCGDQSGLVEFVGGRVWCQIAADLVEALNLCSQRTVAA